MTAASAERTCTSGSAIKLHDGRAIVTYHHPCNRLLVPVYYPGKGRRNVAPAQLCPRCDAATLAQVNHRHA